jgi:phenylacetic acid degradation protein/carnitine operon protein CaiE
MFPGITVILKENAHVGHGAVIHGAIIGRNCLIGMNAVVMDNVVLGDECIVGALSFIKSGEKIAARSVVAGNPARVIKPVTDEQAAWKLEGTRLYQLLANEMPANSEPCEPLRQIPAGRPVQPSHYKTWKSAKDDDVPT